jgi:transcription antitermination factor NusG
MQTFNNDKRSNTSGWYVVYTNARHEKKVYEALKFQRYTAYLPLIKQVSMWSDRQKTVEKPLFPSYVFVYLKNQSNYYQVLQIKGTLTFVRFENRLALLKDTEIEKIKILIENSSNIELSPPDFKIGEKRKIRSGPLSGFDCELVSYYGKKKIIVRIESLKQDILAELKVSCF